MPCHNSRSSQTVTDRQTYKHTYLSFVSLMLMYYSCIITIRNEVVKVMFLQVSVCPHRGEGVSASVHGGIHSPWSRHPQSRHPPGADTPPQSRHPPWSRHPQEQTPPGAEPPPPGANNPPRADNPPPRSRQPPRADTPTPQSRHPREQMHPPPREQTPPSPERWPLLRTVHILLECTLVSGMESLFESFTNSIIPFVALGLSY